MFAEALSAQELGMVVLALAVVAGLAGAVKRFFFDRPPDPAGSRCDVTRREHEQLRHEQEQLRRYCRRNMHGVRDALNALALKVERLLVLSEQREREREEESRGRGKRRTP